MLNQVRETLRRLRSSFGRRADEAYQERDAAKRGSHEAAYAEGEGHAYGVAEEEVLKAEREDNEPSA